MKYAGLLATILLLLVFLGCGGGGAVTQITLTGLVKTAANGGAPNPAATVQVGGVATQTATDGSFSLRVSPGVSELLVNYLPSAGATPVVFRFTFPPATANTDLGDFIVGPEKIRMTGLVRSTSDSSLLQGVTVTLAGRTATTGADGRFTLTDVAYDSASPGGFFLYEGRAGRSGFFPRAFNPDASPVGDLATVSDILLQPDTGDAPPGTPFSIEGIVSPSDRATGSIVELRQSTSVVRRVTVNASRRYAFWVPVGTYTVRAYRPETPTAFVEHTVTLSQPTQIIRRDVTLP